MEQKSMEQKRTVQLEEADWYFRKMVRRFVKERDKVTVEGVTLPGLLILNKLAKDGEQRLGDLAEQLDLTSGAITALCDKLEEGQFADRKRQKEDRRTVVLDITDKGREMLLRNWNIGQQCINVLFDSFSEEELADQIRYFQRMIENLEHFSETILQLAVDNAAVWDRDNAIKLQARSGSTYLTY